MSDALTIARFCWPERSWRHDTDGIAPDDVVISDGPEFAIYRDFTEIDDVRVAELAVIERGLAKEYGKALLVELGMRGQEGDGSWTISMLPGIDHAKLATAPLDARVRALAAVIRAQEEKA